MFTELMMGAPKRKIPLLTKRSQAASTKTTPYVARINTRTMKLEKVLRLDKGKGGFINYTGGLLVHSNGFLYAVAQGYLYKIKPGSFEVVAHAALPAAPSAGGGPNEMTTYNGIAAAANGDLLLKGWASSGGEGDEPPGMLLRVDPADLEIKPDPPVPVSGISSARMALVKHGNTSPTTRTPARLFAKGIADGSELHDYRAFRGRHRVGWNFFMVAGDPYSSGMVAVGDQATGRVAGFQACGGGKSAVKRWENDKIKSSAGMAINYKAGHLYTDDRRCQKRKCRLFLVVLDLRTGRELSRVRVRGTKPSMGQIFIGRNAVYYVATQTGTKNGYVTRITARPSA